MTYRSTASKIVRVRSLFPIYFSSSSWTSYLPYSNLMVERSTGSVTQKYWKGERRPRLIASGRRISAAVTPPKYSVMSCPSIRSGVAVSPRRIFGVK